MKKRLKFAYISPSVLPSRSANSIHVVHQCNSLSEAGVEITLFAKRQCKESGSLEAALHSAYGVDFKDIGLNTIYTPWSRGNNLMIALNAMMSLIVARYDVVLSRNLIASFILSFVSPNKLLIEVHQIEKGFRAWMQKMSYQRRGVKIITISNRLAEDLREIFDLPKEKILVLHDAAPEASEPIQDAQKQEWRNQYIPKEYRDRFICGYVGHLYPGRGIEIIEDLAHKHPTLFFVIIGGNEEDIRRKREANALDNVIFLGHLSHVEARLAMSSVDTLLMPYQEKVSIGLKGSDTARWMSPMKMFEYMSSRTAFIASDLPVLREVLKPEHNALLAKSDDVEDWSEKLMGLVTDPRKREFLAANAFNDYKRDYSWASRARQILAYASK